MKIGVIIGASKFPRHELLASGLPFYNSAQEFARYLRDPQGLNITSENLLDLFDDSRSSASQLAEIGEFLERTRKKADGNSKTPVDLIIYYVGHGGFTPNTQEYFLAVRATDARNQGASSLRISDFASTIKSYAGFFRRYLILDCCFAASAFREFQTTPGAIARRKTLASLPERGTALLCSSGPKDAARAPVNLPLTMFSGALIDVLRKGSEDSDDFLSFSDLGELIVEKLIEKHGDDFVRPEVQTPYKREGDIAHIPLFPNPAKVRSIAECAVSKNSTERQSEGPQATRRQEKPLAPKRVPRTDEDGDTVWRLVRRTLIHSRFRRAILTSLVILVAAPTLRYIFSKISQYQKPQPVVIQPLNSNSHSDVVINYLAWDGTQMVAKLDNYKVRVKRVDSNTSLNDIPLQETFQYKAWDGSNWTAMLNEKGFTIAPDGKWPRSRDVIAIDYLAGDGRKWTARIKDSSTFLHTFGGESTLATQAETELWKAAENSGNPEDFRVYLKEYPHGAYVPLARERLVGTHKDDEWIGFANDTSPQNRDDELRSKCGDFRRVQVGGDAASFDALCKSINKRCIRVCDWEGTSFSCDENTRWMSNGMRIPGRDGVRVAFCAAKQ